MKISIATYNSKWYNIIMIEKFYSHANIVLNDNLFESIKRELLDMNAEVLCFNIDRFVSKTGKEEEEKNLLIDDVKSIRRFISINSNNKRYIICNKRMLNTSVQEAMLKILEEGNKNNVFIFFTNTINYLLPTILSRCVLYNNNDLLEMGFDIKDNKENRIDDYLDIIELIDKKMELFIKSNKYKDLEKLLILKNEFISGNLNYKYINDYLSLI